MLDSTPSEEMTRVRQEVIWTLESMSQSARERRIIAAMSTSPELWDVSIHDDSATWHHISHETRISGQYLKCLYKVCFIFSYQHSINRFLFFFFIVDECKKIWTELVTDFRNHLEQETPREKWKYEDEMSFIVPYITE